MPRPDHSAASDFAEALSSALQQSHMTLATLREELAARGRRVSVATLSYWQTGRSLPARAGSQETVRTIEQILGLPANALIAPLHATAHPAWNPTSALPTGTGPEAVMAGWDISFDLPMSVMVLSDMLNTGDPGGPERQQVRQLVRANADGLSRIPGVFYANTADGSLPEVRCINGTTLGRVQPLPDQGAVVVEFLLGRELTEGDMHWVEYEVSWPANLHANNSHARTSTRGSAFLTMGATFHGESPVRARLTHQGVADEPAQELVAWDPAPRHLQHTLRNAPPGIFELEWFYDLPGAQ